MFSHLIGQSREEIFAFREMLTEALGCESNKFIEDEQWFQDIKEQRTIKEVYGQCVEDLRDGFLTPVTNRSIGVCAYSFVDEILHQITYKHAQIKEKAILMEKAKQYQAEFQELPITESEEQTLTHLEFVCNQEGLFFINGKQEYNTYDDPLSIVFQKDGQQSEPVIVSIIELIAQHRPIQFLQRLLQVNIDLTTQFQDDLIDFNLKYSLRNIGCKQILF